MPNDGSRTIIAFNNPWNQSRCDTQHQQQRQQGPHPINKNRWRRKRNPTLLHHHHSVAAVARAST